MNILFCDDEPDILEIYQMEFDFHAPEHKYYNALTPESAFEICKNNPIDILFTDLKMPTMSGLELLRELKENNLSPKKAYMITGFTHEFETHHEIFDYVEEVFSKPPNFEELLVLLKKLTASHP